MRKLLMLLFIGMLQVTASSQSILNYSSLTLPDSLKKDADAVYHLEESEIDIESPSKMTIRSHTIVTVLTKAGLRHSVVRIGVNKFRKLEEITIKVYNELGVEISKFKKKDFKLEGTYDGVTLASDSKLYELDFPVPGTPCTIETEYEINCTAILDLQPWFFGSTTESYKKSRYVVKSAIPVKYKAYNFKGDPVVTKEEKKTIYTWELNNKTVPTKETASYGAWVSLPWVDVSPSQFSYDGYPGSLENWKEFGKWSYPFYEEENPFKRERVEFFKSLIKDAATEQEKIAILYRYMQKEFRYVSIQFGIGGFKPFPVSFAEQKKYGDCKGLTHYMKNMLNAVGIKSHAALINAGANEYPVDPAFASSIFNHVILCVPLKNDSVWLECTSKQTLPGMLGTFTENRNALLLTGNGGVIVKTPRSKSNYNQWRATTEAELFDDGSALLNSRVYVSGELWEIVNAYFDGQNKEQVKKALVNAFGYKTPDDLEVKIVADSADGHLVNIKLAYSQFFDFKAGSKYFYPQRQYKLNDETIKPAEERQYDFLFNYPYLKTDHITYKLPAGFARESIPPTKEVTNEYVRYKNSIHVKEETNELQVSTELQLHKHIIPPSKFKEVAESFELIKKDETQKLVLKKQ
jgi:transglutaminase-like putative cysteine protease